MLPRQFAVHIVLVVFACTLGGAQNQPETTFKSGTRVVTVSLFARDQQGHVIRDLKPEDIHVLDDGLEQRIASFHAVDAGNASSPEAPVVGRITPCNRTRASFYYELTYSPTRSEQENRFRKILITSPRPGIIFSYRRAYFSAVEATTSASSDKWQPDAQIAEHACNVAAAPKSLTVSATALPQDIEGRSVFRVSVDGSSFASGSDSTRALPLDYAVCIFDGLGTPLRYAEQRVQQKFTDPKQNISHELQLAIPQGTAAIRFLVRDVAGNQMGAYDFQYTPSFPYSNTNLNSSKQASLGKPFGSTQSSPNSFCGELYWLYTIDWEYQNYYALSNPGGALEHKRLPDFDQLDKSPRAVLYTPTLDIRNQDLPEGIKGITRWNEFFAIDYYGTFWVDKPGEYHFRLTSDDGSKLYIDGDVIIDNDGVHAEQGKTGSAQLKQGEHIIRVSYFQGAPASVVLELRITPPGEKSRVMDLRQFLRPQ